MESPIIVGGVRTPFVKAAGAFNYVPAQELGRLVVRELIERLNLDPATIDEVITGNVAPSDAPNVSRVIALRAGIPKDRVAHTVNRNCASGLEAVTQAYERIRSGQAQAVIAVGVDSMSNIPVLWTKSSHRRLLRRSVTAKTAWKKLRALARIRPRDLAPVIGIKQGLTDPVSGLMMGDTAEKLARQYGISREAQDLFALRSHQRATAAWNEGRFNDEVMTVYPEKAKGAVPRDVGPRENQTLEALGKLKPFFDRRWGTVTVGNSCQVTDGAVALLLMTEERARALGLPRLGRLRGYAYAGCDPSRDGSGARLFEQSRAALDGRADGPSRPRRDQRGLCRAGPGLPAVLRVAAGRLRRHRRRVGSGTDRREPAQRERRSHRAGTSRRRERSPIGVNRFERTGSPQTNAGPGDDVRRRRTGGRGDHRTNRRLMQETRACQPAVFSQEPRWP